MLSQYSMDIYSHSTIDFQPPKAGEAKAADHCELTRTTEEAGRLHVTDWYSIGQ